jgi:hypothetical protein
VPTKEQVLQALRGRGEDIHAAAADLGIPPGEVHLIATGIPADGSEGRPGPLTSPQHLVNANHRNPVRNERVVAWVHERAARDLTRPR